MIAVVPKVVEQFDDVNQQLPMVTRLVIGISSFLADWWWAIAIVIGLALLLGWRALKEPQLKYRFDGFLLRLPFVGRLLRDLHAARLARTLSTMVASRLPIIEGQLDDMLARAAGYLEREFDNFSSTALSLLEPIIIVALGGLVAVVILAILLPILQLQNLAGL